MPLKKVQLLDLNPYCDQRGKLVYLQQGVCLPFSPKRIYYLYDISEGAVRGVHAHKKLQQLIVAIHGSFTIKVYDGEEWEEIRLDQAGRGILVLPGVWRELVDFSEDAVCLVLASEEYEPEDYIFSLEEFEEHLKSVGKA
jgi:dTDP-4-dehydrorhamnose 3,5-epimerase-like enzyme